MQNAIQSEPGPGDPAGHRRFLKRAADALGPGGRRFRVRTRVIGEYDYGWMRLSPHIYNAPEELERVVALIGNLA
ncbi:MAG TPA: hypothetical protein VF212_06215 [Longimicrobiales bacterium]